MEKDYIETLKDELEDAKRRLSQSDKEGRQIIKLQIRQIERDIRRNSMKGKE